VLERVRLPAAERDIDEIWLTIAQDSPTAADALIDQIDTAEIPTCRIP
jgi:plasmid stabilization system protein ParE